MDHIYKDRVLLLENDQEMRRIYEEHLEFSGYEVYSAQTIEEAINVLEYVPVNLIVCNEYFHPRQETLRYLKILRKKGITSSILVLTDDEEGIFDQIPPEETALHTFPLPKDIDQFFKSDINQFISIVSMILDGMQCLILINDSPAEIIELENILIHNNYRICSISDGLKAMEILNYHSFDMIILDPVNRYYPGFMFLEDLYKKEIKTPVILLTSLKITQERVEEKTKFQVADIIHKNTVSKRLIPTIESNI